jgi:hypothetical protein
MATKNSNRYVQRNRRLDGWEVVQAGHKRAAAYARTREEAVKRARAMVRRDGGGEVRIKNAIGKIVDSERVSPGLRSRIRPRRNS